MMPLLFLIHNTTYTLTYIKCFDFLVGAIYLFNQPQICGASYKKTPEEKHITTITRPFC